MIHTIAQSTGHSVRRICESLQVPRSSYYHAAAPTESQRSDAQMSQAISTIFHHHRRRYGYRRIWKQLAAEGITCAPDRVRRLMQEQGLIAIQPKTYVPQTSDGRADRPSPNLLLDQPLPAQPNEVWAGDICFVPPHGTHCCAAACGWLPRPSVPSFPAEKNGSTSPSSSTSAPDASSAGLWPITCAANSSSKP